MFFRNDRVRVAPGTTVRIVSLDRKHSVRAKLLGLGSGELVVSALRPAGLALGCEALVGVTLPGRYVEIELSCVVDWENGINFGLRLQNLSDRQSYAITLLRDVLGGKATAVASRRAATR